MASQPLRARPALAARSGARLRLAATVALMSAVIVSLGHPAVPLSAAPSGGSPSAAQSTAAGAAAPAVPAFSSRTDLVVMHAVVRDRHGTPREGLPQSAFRLFEDGRAREVSLFAHQEEPVTVGVVLDASGSMLGNRARLAYATGRFAAHGHADDEVFALTVGDRVRSVLPPEQPFTSDAAVLQQALMRKLGSRGRTALWDGVAEGLRHLARGSHTRRALVVLTDGHDNHSRTTFDEVLLQTQASNAAVYVIGLVDRLEFDRRPKTLRKLAESSGGAAFFPESHNDAERALEDIAREIRSAYTLGFAPGSGRDGVYHHLQVQVTDPDGHRLDVRTRAGYLAGRTED